MTEDCQKVFEQQSEELQKIETHSETELVEENGFEFDCPKSFDFKDPNADDLNEKDDVMDTIQGMKFLFYEIKLRSSINFCFYRFANRK